MGWLAILIGLWAVPAYAEDRTQTGPAWSVGAGAQAFTEDLAQKQWPGPRLDAFIGYAIQDAYAPPHYRLGLALAYSAHPGRDDNPWLHRGLVGWQGMIGFPMTPTLSAELGLKMGIVILSRTYGVGYNQSALAALGIRTRDGFLLEPTLALDLTNKHLFFTQRKGRVYGDFNELAVSFGLTMTWEHLIPRP